MRVVSNLFGIAAVRVSGDDVAPLAGFNIQKIIQTIGDRYSFSAKPNVNMFVSGQPIAFQVGKWTKDASHEYPVIQLILVSNGDIVASNTTDTADEILTDFIGCLQELGYRYDQAQSRRIYQSHLVVQFDHDLGKLSVFEQISRLLKRAGTDTRPEFQLKRLAFGQGDPIIHAGVPFSIELIESADFYLERRAREPYPENRYYSSAPMTTKEHQALLEEIEKLLA